MVARYFVFVFVLFGERVDTLAFLVVCSYFITPMHMFANEHAGL